MKPILIGLILGVSLGIALPATALGVGATHTVCVEGAVMGWSGLIATPTVVGLAPPGGLVNVSYSEHVTVSSTYSWTDSAASAEPVNDSSVDVGVSNWTLVSILAEQIPGWGPVVHCPTFSWGRGSLNGLVSGGCDGCQIAPPVPGGIGNRLEVPTQFYYDSVPSTILNASYTSSPAATFTWNGSARDVTWSSTGPLENLTSYVGPFYEGKVLVGLGVQVHYSSIHFGVPIQLTDGSREVIPASFPADIPGPWENATIAIDYSYVFPLSTSQGSWQVYVPGLGSPYATGGLLFVQTAGP